MFRVCSDGVPTVFRRHGAQICSNFCEQRAAVSREHSPRQPYHRPQPFRDECCLPVSIAAAAAAAAAVELESFLLVEYICGGRGVTLKVDGSSGSGSIILIVVIILCFILCFILFGSSILIVVIILCFILCFTLFGSRTNGGIGGGGGGGGCA